MTDGSARSDVDREALKQQDTASRGSDMRTRLAPTVFAAGLVLVAAAAFALLLYLGRHGTFFYDEWTLIDTRMPVTFDGLMAAHNEHWSLLLIVTYLTLFSIFGFSSYIPYLCVLLALHVIVAVGLIRILRPIAGTPLTLSAAVLFLLLGSGHENLFWAFQIGFVGATAAGLWALESAVHRRSPLIASILLVASCATQGVGLFFVGTLFVYLVADRRPWSQIALTVGPAIAAYGLWYVTYGRAAVDLHRNPFSVDALSQLPSFVLAGGAGGFAAITGLGQQVGLIAFVMVAGASLAALYHGRPHPLMLAAVAGLVIEFSLVGLVRAQYGVEQATAGRYVYVSALFALIAAIAWIGRPRQQHPLMLLAVLPVLAIALGSNAVQLEAGRSRLATFGAETRAVVALVMRDASLEISTDDDPIRYLGRPSRVRALVAEHGSPVDVELEPGDPPIQPATWDVALFRLIEHDLVPSRLDGLPGDLSEIELLDSSDVVIRDEGPCVGARVVGPDPWVAVNVPPGEELIVQSDMSGAAQLFVYWHGAPQEATSTTLPLLFDVPHAVSLPHVAEPRVKARVDPPPGSELLLVCGR